jgi:NADH dehydrogenase [ubiquinone] 1 alpha subcomplex assembly factor 7
MDGEFSYVELGPGKGTLLADMWRTWNKDFKYRVKEINLIEASKLLREKQRTALGHVSRIISADEAEVELEGGVKVRWFNSLKEVPPSPLKKLIMAHEFYDALPIHQFQKKDGRLREVLVDLNKDDEFSFVLSSKESVVCQTLKQFYHVDEIGDGEVVEFSPAAVDLTNEITELIKDAGGVALIADYGRDGCSPASLRGIRQHQFVHPLSQVGETDLSADVDFKLIRKVAKKQSVPVSSTMKQGEFLLKMGVELRLSQLLEKASSNEEADKLVSGFMRLTGTRRSHMGAAYKFIALGNAVNYPFY